MCNNKAPEATTSKEDQKELEKPLLLPNHQEENGRSATTSNTTTLDSYLGHVICISCYLAVLAFVLWWRADTILEFRGLVVNSDDGISINLNLPWLQLLPLVAVVFLLVYLLWSEVRYLILRRRMPPGDHGYPCLGHAPHMFLQDNTFFGHQQNKYGPIFTMNMLMRPCVVFMEDDDVAWIQSQERKEKCINEWPDHLQDLVGHNNFFTKSGNGHRKLRRLFEPAFSPKAVRGYLEVMDQNIRTDLKQWATTTSSVENEDSTFLSTQQDVKQNTLKTFFLCCFSNNQINDETIVELNRLIRVLMEGISTPIPIAYPGSALRKAHYAKEKINVMLTDLVLQFKEQYPNDTPEARQSFVGHFIHEKDNDEESEIMLTVDEIVENLFVIIVAGYDTSANAFGSALHYLYHNPKLQEALFEEVQQFAEPLDYDELKEAPILNAFLAEIWRVDAARLPHMTRVTQDLQYKGYTIPKGAGAYFIFGQAMLHPNWYIEPNEFKIERFLPKDHPLGDAKYHAEGVNYSQVVSNHKYRGFGGGIHSCVGHNFAKLQARIAVTRLVQNYSIKIGSEKKINFPLDGWDVQEFQLLPKANSKQGSE